MSCAPRILTPSPSLLQPPRPKVDWAALGRMLPAGRDAKSKRERDRLFDTLDVDGGGTARSLTYKEVERGLVKLLKGSGVIDFDPAPAIRSAFDLANHQHEARTGKVLDESGHKTVSVPASQNSAASKIQARRRGQLARRDPKKAAPADGEEEVQRIEFRLLLSYLRHHFELLVMFDIVDTSDDMAISLAEFKSMLPQVRGPGHVCRPGACRPASSMPRIVSNT